MGAAALIGAQMVGSYLSNKRGKKAVNDQKKLARQRALMYQRINDPAHYNYLMNQYRNQFQTGYMPALRQLGDTLGLNESNAQEAFNSDAARRGLSGSGVAMAGQNSIRAARMAGLGQAQQNFAMDVESGARQAAGAGVQNELRGVESGAGDPYGYYGTPPSTLEGLLGGTPEALRMSAQYGQLTGASGNFGSLLGLKGGPDGQYGPQMPYYIGQQPGRG